MHNGRTGRADLPRPEWDSDRLNSTVPPAAVPPYFDTVLEAWVLSRHEDVLAAFRSSHLVPAGADGGDDSEVPDEMLLAMRQETREALSPSQLRAWRDRLTPRAYGLAFSLARSEPVDLVSEYARPACLALAAMVTGLSVRDAERLQTIARPVSMAAAEPFDAQLRADAAAATAQMKGCFHAEPAALQDSGFVALAHTMPCLLANAWYTLLQQPKEWSMLHQQPELVEQAVEELLRYAGLTRVLYRRANRDVAMHGFLIRKGQRIILRIIAANRDPKRFAQPNQIDVRRGGGQLTLGAGPHACVAANLIRMAANTMTRPLLEIFATGRLTQRVAWQGGSGFRSPAALHVVLREGASGSRRLGFAQA
jgi:cytochrome P450